MAAHSYMQDMLFFCRPALCHWFYTVSVQVRTPLTFVVVSQDVVTDFDSHHIGLQQPHAAPQQETDTKLHHQPAPDVTSSQPSSTFSVTISPVHSPTLRQQAAQSSHDSSDASTSATPAPHDQQQQPQDGASEASSSAARHDYGQAGTATFPQQQQQQSQSQGSAGPQTTPSSADQQPAEQEQPSVDTFAYQQDSGSDVVYPPPPGTPQPPETAQQLSVDARGETPSYTPAAVEHTSPSTVAQSGDQPTQQDPAPQGGEGILSASQLDESSAVPGSEDAAETSSSSRDQASAQYAQVSTAPANAAEEPADSVTPDAATIDSEAGDAQPGHDSTVSGVPDGAQPSQAAASRAGEQADGPPRGVGFPAGPPGEILTGTDFRLSACCEVFR